MATVIDEHYRVVKVGDDSAGISLLVVNDGGDVSVALAPVGAADVTDEGVAAIRLDAVLGRRLATALLTLLSTP